MENRGAGTWEEGGGLRREERKDARVWPDGRHRHGLGWANLKW